MYDKLRALLFSCETRILAFDPGETTGVACLKGGDVELYEQFKTKPIGEGAELLHGLIRNLSPDFLICEDYRIYAWKADDHKWNPLHTPALIGAVQYICYMEHLPYHMEMAQVPKAFTTDDKLRGLGLYLPGKPHARDAMRHAVWWILFKLVNAQQLNGGVRNDEGKDKPLEAGEDA
jgi:hypothetical protein